MEKVKITFLGTANSVPTKNRNHTGIFVSFGGENILIDCGENIQRQIRIAGISYAKINRIFITHWHGDHTLGLPGLFQTLALNNLKKEILIYGPFGTKKLLNKMFDFIGKLDINLKIFEVEEGIFFDSKHFYFSAHNLKHGIASLGYSLVLKDRIRLDKEKLKKYNLPSSPILGKLQSGEDIVFNGKKINYKSVSYLERGKKITIILDTIFDSSFVDFSKNSDLLICESTFSKSEKEKAKEYFHMTAEDAALLAKRSKSKKLILTHISEKYENNKKDLEKEAKKIFDNVSIAEDFFTIEV